MYDRNRKLRLPSNLDLDDLLIDKPAEVSKGIKADYLAYICNTLISLKALYRQDALKENGLVKLNARILSEHVYSYRRCLDYLEKNGIIVSDHCYSVSNESTGYDFAESYLGSGFKTYEIRDAQFKRTLATHAEKEHQKAKQKLSGLLATLYDFLIRTCSLIIKEHRNGLKKAVKYTWTN